MNSIEISIITPLYNSRSWLPGLIETAQCQVFTAFEHILVDDCSDDGSAEEARALASKDSRIKVLQMEQNSGPAAARNLGIGAARGRYLAFLDADDLWLPEKLQNQVSWMKRHGHAFTYHDYRHMSHDGEMLGSIVRGPDLLTRKSLHTHRGTGGCLSVMVDRQQMPWFHFPDVGRSLPEDFLAWLSVIERGHKGHRLAEDLGRYRLTQNSRSSDKLASARRVWHLYRNVERLPRFKALSWWLQYAWNANRLHRRARPLHPATLPLAAEKAPPVRAKDRFIENSTYLADSTVECTT